MIGKEEEKKQKAKRREARDEKQSVLFFFLLLLLNHSPGTSLVQAHGLSHRRLDVEGADVLPVLLQERDEEVDSHLDVDVELLLFKFFFISFHFIFFLDEVSFFEFVWVLFFI